MADAAQTGREHIETPPLWITVIRGVQFLFNIIVMATAANAASYFYLDGYGMAFFTFVWTVFFLLYIFLAPRFMPRLYHFWVHVGLEVLTVIWWLITMALLAHYTRAWSGRRYGYWRSGIADSTRAATAFAVLNWLLFLVTLGAILFLSRRATIDGSHTHTTSTSSPTGGSSFGAKFSSLFARKPRTTDPEAAKTGAGTELGGGPVHNNGAPTGTNDYGVPYGAGTGHTNTTGATNDGYGQHWAGTGGETVSPPSATAPHYGQQNRY